MHEYFTRIDPSVNARKHYWLALIEPVPGKFEVRCAWGRLGHAVQERKVEVFFSRRRAEMKYNVICNGRLRKGYVRTSPTLEAVAAGPSWWPRTAIAVPDTLSALEQERNLARAEADRVRGALASMPEPETS